MDIIIIKYSMGKTAAKKAPKRVPKPKKTGPKKPKSGFMFFSQERRKTLKEEQPSVSITDASKIIGAEWKKLNEEERRHYEESAQKDRERYRKEKDDAEDCS